MSYYQFNRQGILQKDIVIETCQKKKIIKLKSIKKRSIKN